MSYLQVLIYGLKPVLRGLHLGKASLKNYGLGVNLYTYIDNDSIAYRATFRVAFCVLMPIQAAEDLGFDILF